MTNSRPDDHAGVTKANTQTMQRYEHLGFKREGFGTKLKIGSTQITAVAISSKQWSGDFVLLG